MSFQAMTWAVEQRLPANQKLVLLMLANFAGNHLGECYPSHERLADDCGMGKTTVKECIKRLAEAGLLTVVPRSTDGVSLPNVYRLHLGVVGVGRHPTHPVGTVKGVGPQPTDGGAAGDGGVGRQPTTNQSNQPVIEPVKNHKGAYPLEFETAWAAYPSRPGASKADSHKAWAARIHAGAEADAILAGVQRYAAYCVAQKTAPQYIKQPATFFGPGLHFEADWTVPAATGEGVRMPQRGNRLDGAAAALFNFEDGTN